MTWEQVSTIVGAGLASNYFSVGDTKTITINGTVGTTTFSNLFIDAFILGINHNARVEGENLIHFGLGKIGGVDVCLVDSSYDSNATSSGKFAMNTGATNAGGWASSHMRKTVLGSDANSDSPTANTLLAALSAELNVVLKSITKYTDNTANGGGNNASYVTPTTDYLPLLSEIEMRGNYSYANSAENNYQKQYDYYKAGNSKIKHKHSSTTTVAEWWLRTANNSTNYNFCTMGDDGTPRIRYANRSYGLAPVFAVGGNVESSGSLISFTMNGVTYQAEKDMTWVDYVNSSYNTLSLTVASGGQIKHPSGGYIWRNVGSTLTLVNYNGVEATIVDGMDYYWDE